MGFMEFIVKSRELEATLGEFFTEIYWLACFRSLYLMFLLVPLGHGLSSI